MTKNLLLKFKNAKVGFKEVEQIAEQMVKQQKSSLCTRDDKYDIVKDLMKHKMKDSVRCLKISKQNLNKSNSCLSKTVRKGTIAREAFMEMVDNELNYEWKTGKNKMKDKISWAVHKYKGIKKEPEKVFNGILVGDEELENFESNNEALKQVMKASVYGDVEVNKEEEEILLLPPDHQTFPKLNIE